MDERGNRVFGLGDGELDAASARRIVAAGLRGHRARPAAGVGDAAVVFLGLAAFVAFVWWATC